ncbi:MAG: DUF3253 domain-containing protein [Sedimentitalea sp.]
MKNARGAGKCCLTSANTATPACANAVTTLSDKHIADAILHLVQQRGVGKTLCPSEVARALGDDWRALMSQIRRVADDLATTGHIRITQKGHTVQAQTARGPIRLGLP